MGEEDWSEDKKAWCCAAGGAGCTTTTIAPTPVPTPDPKIEIVEKIEIGLAKFEVLEEQLAHLDKVHQITTTLPETTLPEDIVCTARMEAHEGWCRRVCDNPNKSCKSLCPERCSLSTC